MWYSALKKSVIWFSNDMKVNNWWIYIFKWTYSFNRASCDTTTQIFFCCFWENVSFGVGPAVAVILSFTLTDTKVCYILCRGLYFLMFLSLFLSFLFLSLSHTHTHVLSFLAQRKNESLCSRHRKLQCVRDVVFNNSYTDNHEREREREGKDRKSKRK